MKAQSHCLPTFLKATAYDARAKALRSWTTNYILKNEDSA